MHWNGLATLALALVVTTGTGRAETCASARSKVVGRLESGLLTCQAKVAATNDASQLAACRAKALAKFPRAWAKGGCAGDQTACSETAADCESTVVGLLADTFPSKCESRKRRAAGKLARAELDCYARAAAEGLAVDPACINRARDKFDRAVVVAGTCPHGAAPRDAVEQSCVNPALTTDCLGGMLPPDLTEIPLCCDARGVCFDGSTTPGTQGQLEASLFLSHCGRGGGLTHVGSTCERLPCPPELPPGIECGTCQAVPFQTTTVCCQQDGACVEQTVATWSELLNVPCNLPPAGSDNLIQGTCAANGACVPGP